MEHSIILMFFAIVLPLEIYGQDANKTYYQEIIPPSQQVLTSAKLQELEEVALRKSRMADSYFSLAKAFGITSERVWAVVYGEIFCNLTSEPKPFLEISSHLGQMFEKSLIYEDKDNATISFMKVAEIDPETKVIPFEMHFELSVAYGFGDYEQFRNLSIATIHEIRSYQLGIWKEKDLPKHGLISWHQTLQKEGMFEVYNYWLFQQFRPEEYAKWKTKNSEKLGKFLIWRKANPIDLSQKNFHRLH